MTVVFSTDSMPAKRDDLAVSIIIVNYHAYDELAACLTSLSRQTLAQIEVIVIDHDSQRTRYLDVLRRFPTIQFIPSTANPGFAAGVNRAASLARGKYLYLLNPDATADADVCWALSQWLDTHPEIGAVGSLVRNEGGSIQASARRFPDATTAIGGRSTWLTRVAPLNPLTRRNLLTGPEVQEPKLVDWVSGASMMVRREAFEAIRGMDPDFFLYWEDADFCYRLLKAGWRTAYYPGSGITHLCGRSSRSSAASISAFHNSAFRYFQKHSGGLIRVSAPLIYVGLKIRLHALLWLHRLAGAGDNTPPS